MYLYQTAKYDGDNYFELFTDSSSANAWQILFKVEQDLLQFTSLELKYAQYDGYLLKDAGLDLTNFIAKDIDPVEKYRKYFARADQAWGDTAWGSWLEYTHTQMIEGNWKNSTYGIGVNYQYNPSVQFELAFDVENFHNDDPNDNKLTFKTMVSF